MSVVFRVLQMPLAAQFDVISASGLVFMRIQH